MYQFYGKINRGQVSRPLYAFRRVRFTVLPLYKGLSRVCCYLYCYECRVPKQQMSDIFPVQLTSIVLMILKYKCSISLHNQMFLQYLIWIFIRHACMYLQAFSSPLTPVLPCELDNMNSGPSQKQLNVHETVVDIHSTIHDYRSTLVCLY